MQRRMFLASAENRIILNLVYRVFYELSNQVKKFLSGMLFLLNIGKSFFKSPCILQVKQLPGRKCLYQLFSQVGTG